MSIPLITALRRRDDLKESVQHTAQELAHLASIYGVARVSYGFLAEKAHCSKRTAIRHIQQLINAKIIRKVVIWIKGNFCEINQYTFVIPWKKQPANLCSSDKMASTLPPKEREKETSVRNELENQKKALRLGFVTPGTDLYQKVSEEIVRLEGLLVDRCDCHSTYLIDFIE